MGQSKSNISGSRSPPGERRSDWSPKTAVRRNRNEPFSPAPTPTKNFSQNEPLSPPSPPTEDWTNFDYLFNFLLIGDPKSGKSSLILRFFTDVFLDQPRPATTCFSKHLRLKSQVAKLQIWDVPPPTNFQRAHVVLITVDLTNRESYEKATYAKWCRTIDVCGSDEAYRIFVGTKSDLATQRKITTQEMIQVAKEFDARYTEVSAKTGENVDSLFYFLTSLIYLKKQEEKLSPWDGFERYRSIEAKAAKLALRQHRRHIFVLWLLDLKNDGLTFLMEPLTLDERLIIARLYIRVVGVLTPAFLTKPLDDEL